MPRVLAKIPALVHILFGLSYEGIAMGFFIRKGISFGPIRFNLSKSEIDVSAGIKGARVVGTDG